ncbi:MAG: GNAT family N-acetyltransferase [Alphaproteobacteria bacterium]
MVDLAYSLRRAGPEDAAILSALKIACWRDTYVGRLPADLLASLDDDPFHSVEAWRAVLDADGPERVTEIVALDGNDIGLLRYGPYDGMLPGWRGKIDAIYLLAPARGQGLGARLIAHARLRLAAMRLAPVAIDVFEFNARARRLYERLGARAIGRAVAFEHAGEPIEEVVLGWPEVSVGV